MSKHKTPPSPQSLGLPRVGVETHAHLDYPPFDPETLAPAMERAEQAGVELIGNVFLGLGAFAANSPHFASLPQVFFLLGIHPGDAGQYKLSDVADLAGAFAAETRLKAVGEIGLDYHWEDAPSREVQAAFFREQLALAKEVDRPVAVHCRDAAEDALRILDDSGLPGERVLWHCFSHGPDLGLELLRRGYTVSIPGPVTYPRNQDLRRAVAVMDLGRLVLESDSPFLSPQPYRGKPNEPAYNAFTAVEVARLKGLAPAEVWRITGENARRFYGL